MAAPDPTYDSKSAKALTFAAYAAFVPIGIATVLLGPDVADLVGAMEPELFAGRSAVHGAVYGFDGGRRTVGSAGVALGISIRDQDWARV